MGRGELPQQSSLADRSTERFIDFQQWTTARKSVLLMAIALAPQIVLSVTAYVAARASRIVDVRLLGWTLVAGCLVVVVLLAVAFVEVRRERTGEWTAYLVIAVYGGWLGALVFGFGGWSTVFMGWALLVVVLVGVWYDERKARLALAYFSAAVATLVVLTLVGAIDYAPGLVGRGIDDQNSLGFVALVFTPLVGFFGFTVVTTNLVVRAQRLQQERLRVAHALIRRYVPASVADGLDGRDGEDGFGVDRVKLTVFFSDIEGFTELADELDPEDLALVLNQYLDEMAQSAEAHGSSINHFEGDGIMIFFGAPRRTDPKQDAVAAVRMAFDMQHRLAALRDQWLDLGIRAPLQARMGINTGYASVGDFGSPGRKIYTAIGIQVNAAARIQAHCPPGRVLVSGSTQALIRNEIDTVERGELDLKGIHYPITTFEAVEHADDRSTRQH